ncbi:MAG: hypothetical protein PHW12_02405 [Smithella sp.]|nr:hypothetical protein [Smithella sp.]MDD5673088.1 hypothetical protein [Chitinivibrionales bacterium]
MTQDKKKRNTDDVDWNELLTAGSMIGNLLQAADRSQLKAALNLSREQVTALMQQKMILKTQLTNLRSAFEKMKIALLTIEEQNKQLNQSCKEKDNRITELTRKIESLGGKA